jgi:carbamoyltransferase
MKRYLGISAGFHDASAAVINDHGEIEFAAHSERYSKIKNDSKLHCDLVCTVSNYEPFDTVAYYERPWLHNLQQFWSGQKNYGPWTTKQVIKQHLMAATPDRAIFKSYSHHLTHAAAGFQTSPFNQAAVVVIDAIGELDTISIFKAWYDSNGKACYRRLWRQQYPHSIGLFYSAITDFVKLKPMEEEYITMGMAAYGSPRDTLEFIKNHYVEDVKTVKFKRNLHIGFGDGKLNQFAHVDIAAAGQALAEEMIMNIMRRARMLTGCDCLVYMGGVALNCVANSQLGQWFDQIWIMPNPGDAGSSLGAAALAYGKKLQWVDAFLGFNIEGEYPVDNLVDHLLKKQMVGVASGRSEWGPRALGNRSLLADPRGKDIKDRVNRIKKRQRFRPFAPVILEELVDKYFIMPSGWSNSRYMQIVAKCRHPDEFPAITHVDQTSRVQTVPKDGSGIRRLLERWYSLTGCPMLLNTSLNVRGEPMVNDRIDANRFEKIYGIKVFS